MPLFYLDTSPIVKRYRNEVGTEVIVGLIDNANPDDRFYTSFLSILELTPGAYPWSLPLELTPGAYLRNHEIGEG